MPFLNIAENYKIYTCGDTRHGKLCQDGDMSEEGHFGPEQITRFANYKVTNVSCGGCHTIICAQKEFENWNNSLPPLQRVPNTILNEIKTEAALEMTEKNVNGDMSQYGIENMADNHNNMNGISHDIQVNGNTDETLKNSQNSDDISRLPAHLSEIIKSQKEQLDAEYEKTISSIKTESTIISDKIVSVQEDTENAILEDINQINEVTGLKPLKDHIASDSVDNLLQEIEDDLSNKSSKTFTSDTISVKSNSNGKSVEEIEEVATEIKINGDNDEEDLKVPQPERKFSRLFGTFKKKKVSASSTDSKVLETDNIERTYYFLHVNEINVFNKFYL